MAFINKVVNKPVENNYIIIDKELISKIDRETWEKVLEGVIK